MFLHQSVSLQQASTASTNRAACSEVHVSALCMHLHIQMQDHTSQRVERKGSFDEASTISYTGATTIRLYMRGKVPVHDVRIVRCERMDAAVYLRR